MKLHDYPDAIAQSQRQLLSIQQQLRVAKETVAFCLSDIERKIAFDDTLKNEVQRKARKQQLMETDHDYIEANVARRRLEDEQAELEIELGLLKNQFSVLKLETRRAIASLEAQSAIAA